MPRGLDTRTFKGGMNKDLDYSILPNDAYIHAENFQIFVNSEDNSITLQNAEGNVEALSFDSEIRTNANVVGYCYINSYLVIFATENNGTPASNKYNYIIRINVSEGHFNDVVTIYDDQLATDRLDFSPLYPIQATGQYETNDIIKVYWSDGYNEDRWVNIMDSSVASQEIDMFSMTPNVPTLSGTTDARAEFVELISGSISASSVQYTYQYYTLNGASTKYAPLSPSIPIGQGNPNGNVMTDYSGVVKDENTYNGCNIKINSPSTKKFNRIRIIALDYDTINTSPSVRIVGEYEINRADTSTELYYKDIGQSVGEITYDEFLTQTNVTYKSKDLASKNNVLYKGNIEEEVFDVEFDARAYRFEYNGGSPEAKVYDSNLTSYYTIQPNGDWVHSVSGSGNSWLLPTTADAINLYNDPDYEGNSAYQFKFQEDGTSIGAKGPNIEILSTVAPNLYLDEIGTGVGLNSRWIPSNNSNPSDPYNVAYFSNRKRHEVYRLGVVFFNQKLQSSPVKWMCDYKMPHNNDNSAFAFSDLSSSTDITTRNLGISVTLSNMPSDAYAWQIVAVKREPKDRSVLGSGIMQSPVGDDYGAATPSHSYYFVAADTGAIGGGGASSTPDLTTQSSISNDDYSDELFIFISPEISFTENITHTVNDFLTYEGYFEYGSSNSIVVSSSAWAAHKLNDLNTLTDYTNSNYKADVDDFKKISQPSNDKDRNYVGGFIFSNYIGKDTAFNNTYNGVHMSCGVGQSDDLFTLPGSTNTVPVVTYRTNRFESQYGGIDYYARQKNEYIGISEVRYGNVTLASYEGDSVIDMFWAARQAIDLNDVDDSWFVSIMFPIETDIVLGLRHDTMQFTSNNTLLMREVSGLYEETKLSTDLYYDQEYNLYSYNTVYSNNDSGQKYLDVLFDQSDQTYFPVRVMYSDIKENGEVEDSYTIFRTNNYKDLDGKYGQINNLINFKDRLYYWQDSAFGTLGVNDRSLIQDNNPGVLALGSGGILSRYDYISTTVGNQSPYSIVTSNKAICWVDNNTNEVYTFNGTESSESKVKGIQSWINDTGKLGYIKGVYDSKNNNIIFTLGFARQLVATDDTGTRPNEYATYFSIEDESDLSTSDPYNTITPAAYEDNDYIVKNNKTLSYSAGNGWELSDNPRGDVGDVYYTYLMDDPAKQYTLSINEVTGKFVAYHSFKPNFYFQADSNYYSVYNYRVYRHNAGNKCQYYGTYYDSVITTVFNKDFPLTKVYDVVKWHSESESSSDINIFKDTFDKAEFYTDYQHTGDRTLYYQQDTEPVVDRTTPISRRERTWSLQVPRDIVTGTVESNPDIFDSANWSETTGRNTRIRDKYLATSFTYENNSNNYVFSVPFVSAIYRRSYR